MNQRAAKYVAVARVQLAANDPIVCTVYVPEENDYALIRLNW
jgi:hypothetical protein